MYYTDINSTFAKYKLRRSWTPHFAFSASFFWADSLSIAIVTFSALPFIKTPRPGAALDAVTAASAADEVENLRKPVPLGLLHINTITKTIHSKEMIIGSNIYNNSDNTDTYNSNNNTDVNTVNNINRININEQTQMDNPKRKSQKI